MDEHLYLKIAINSLFDVSCIISSYNQSQDDVRKILPELSGQYLITNLVWDHVYYVIIPH